ncbi:MAG TPA: GPP34 family phosphoprotein [Rhodanobacteraceae bacterium]|nr:GPP34 family phosphoprotein [Rhodanobacteraceae bacterium]
MLATDLLLLVLDDERGTVLPQAALGLDYGLAGAVVMELALRGRIRLDGDVVSTTGTATDDALLDDALRSIAATPGKNLSHWVWHLSRDLGGLRQRLLDRLVARGTLERRERRVLLLFHQNVYPERDTRVEHDIRARVDAALLQGATPDAQTACLIHLAAACRVTDAIYPRDEHKAIRKRIAGLDDAGAAGANAVAALVAQAETAAVTAATMAAITASTVAATSAATTAACSASSVACH